MTGKGRRLQRQRARRSQHARGVLNPSAVWDGQRYSEPLYVSPRRLKRIMKRIERERAAAKGAR